MLLEATLSELEVVDEFVEYMVYCCATRGNLEMTVVAGMLVAVNFLHEHWVGRALSYNHFRSNVVKKGIKRMHMTSRSRSWGMLKGMEGGCKEWGVCGRVAWIRLALSCLMLLRTSELSAEHDARVHVVHCLRGDNVASYAGGQQVKGGDSQEVEAVEVPFQSTKGE